MTYASGSSLPNCFVPSKWNRTLYGRLWPISPSPWYLASINGTIYPMAMNIKDPEVDQLAGDLAARMGHNNKTRAIRDALRAQLAITEARDGNRVTHLLDTMRTEIWPLLPDSTPITKPEREAILGYDPTTGV